MTHFELLKYAATGIASPGMTAYDKMRAFAMAGGKVKTLTGVPPLSFKANGKPLASWSISGNSQQNGTPAPSAPIMPTFCGERTGNLFDYQTMAGTLKGYYLDSNGNLWESAIAAVTDYIPCSGGKFSLAKVGGIAPSICLYDNNKHFLYGQAYNTESGSDKQTIVVDSSVNASYIRFTYFYAEAPQDNLSTIMLNLGSTPFPYEPYGWKIPVTSAGQTQNVYLGEVQTTRKIKKLVLTGQETTWIYEGEYERFGIHVYGMFVRGTRLVTLICSHYQCIDDGRAIGNVPNNSIYAVGGLTNMLFIKTNSYTTVDAFKTYLQEQYTNGTPVTIWYVLDTPETAIVNEPLAKIGTYADRLDSEDAEVSIPTAKGENTLTVDTELQPSSMTITYR